MVRRRRPLLWCFSRCFGHHVPHPRSLGSPEKLFKKQHNTSEDLWVSSFTAFSSHDKYLRACCLPSLSPGICCSGLSERQFYHQQAWKKRKERKRSHPIRPPDELKVELKLKTYRLCSPSSPVPNETQECTTVCKWPEEVLFLSFFLFLKWTFRLQFLWWQNDCFPLSAMREVAAVRLLCGASTIEPRPSVSSAPVDKPNYFFFFFSAGTCERTLS